MTLSWTHLSKLFSGILLRWIVSRVFLTCEEQRINWSAQYLTGFIASKVSFLPSCTQKQPWRRNLHKGPLPQPLQKGVHYGSTEASTLCVRHASKVAWFVRQLFFLTNTFSIHSCNALFTNQWICITLHFRRASQVFPCRLHHVPSPSEGDLFFPSKSYWTRSVHQFSEKRLVCQCEIRTIAIWWIFSSFSLAECPPRDLQRTAY